MALRQKGEIMNKLAFVLLSLFSLNALSAPNTPGVIQRSPTDSTTMNRFMPVPASNALFFFNASTVLPEMVTIGDGLTYSSGILSASGVQVNSDWNAISGVAQILNKPTQVSAFTNDSGYINSSALSPYLTTSAAASTYATQSSLTTGLSSKFSAPTGTTAQYIRGDGSIATFPASGSGTVTSITAGTGLSGGTITTSGTISLPNTGTAGTYSGVTTDSQGRVTAGTTQIINDNPGRTLVTSTSATGYQISSTRNARACYEGSFSTTSTIGGPASATVYIETADTNSTTPGDWTTKASQTYTNTITLAVVLNQQQTNNWSMCRDIPAGKYVRIRSGAITGTASVALNTTQQETLQ